MDAGAENWSAVIAWGQTHLPSLNLTYGGKEFAMPNCLSQHEGVCECGFCEPWVVVKGAGALMSVCVLSRLAALKPCARPMMSALTVSYF